MNAYETAQSLGITGTDAEIVAALQATGLTHTKISIGDLLFLLRNRAMMTRLIRPADTGEKWGGSLINLILYATDSLPAEVSRSIETFFSHITDDRSQFFDTTMLAHSAPFWAMAQGFGGTPTMPTVDDFQAVAALGGGWQFADLTTEQFTAQRTDAEALSLKQTALTRCTEAMEAAQAEYRSADSTPATIVQAMLDSLGAV